VKCSASAISRGLVLTGSGQVLLAAAGRLWPERQLGRMATPRRIAPRRAAPRYGIIRAVYLNTSHAVGMRVRDVNLRNVTTRLPLRTHSCFMADRSLVSAVRRANVTMTNPGIVLAAFRCLHVDQEPRGSIRSQVFERSVAAADVAQVPAPASRDQAYQAGGETVLDHPDVLVADWDGQGAQSPGGTGGTVTPARQRGLPQVWVPAGNRKPRTLEPTNIGDQQGGVTYELLPETQAGADP
jgi:hypothetical protein